MAKILLVEDDPSLSIVVKIHLESDNYLVDVVKDGLEAEAQLRSRNYDLIILDWMLPAMTGIEVCKQYRARGGKTPVLMLTAKDSSPDKVQGLDAGADDYIVKPFNDAELSARVRALLRRPDSIADKVLKVQNLELDTSLSRVTRESIAIELVPKEFALLQLLMRYPNKAFSAEALLDRLWSSDSSASVETVRTHIKTLRRKLGDTDTNSLIRTTRGIGYRIVDS